MVMLECAVNIIKGDITECRNDAIVNAANKQLDGKFGVSKAIHQAAGPRLWQACQKLGDCQRGDAKITKGYNLPSRYVIHAVGPTDLNPKLLKRCYTESLNLAEANKCRSIAFPCIATGRTHEYNTQRQAAANIALEAVRDYLVHKARQGKSPFDSIVFCAHSRKDFDIYNRFVSSYFPRDANRMPRNQNQPAQYPNMGYDDGHLRKPDDTINHIQNQDRGHGNPEHRYDDDVDSTGCCGSNRRQFLRKSPGK
ncbi:hypothetical protein BGW37DRAFT_196248 [Umbelopsis sp. PMI_123]|nr:hypothetical protein BGW37DRAFT_196248 [Umbelopsis sp. PMI_123]